MDTAGFGKFGNHVMGYKVEVSNSIAPKNVNTKRPKTTNPSDAIKINLVGRENFSLSVWVDEDLNLMVMGAFSGAVVLRFLSHSGETGSFSILSHSGEPVNPSSLISSPIELLCDLQYTYKLNIFSYINSSQRF